MESLEQGQELIESLDFEEIAILRIQYKEIGDTLKVAYERIIAYLRDQPISRTDASKLLIYHAVVILAAAQKVDSEEALQ